MTRAPRSRWRPWIAERLAGSIGRPASAPMGTDHHGGAAGVEAAAPDGLLERLPGLGAHDPHRRELAHAALARAHRHGRVALGELDRVVALGDARLDVLRRDVLAEAREALAAARAGDGGRDGHARALARERIEPVAGALRAAARRGVADADGVGRVEAGELAGAQDRLEPRRALEVAGGVDAVGHLADAEDAGRRVVGALGADLRDERRRGRGAAREDDEIAVVPALRAVNGLAF